MSHQNLSFIIPDQNLAQLAHLFHKLGKRAVKIGLPVPKFTRTHIERKVREVHGQEVVSVLHHIVVDAGTSVVKVQGWEFAATIEHTDDGNLIRAVPRYELPLQYRTANHDCDHCRTHRYRKQTYIMRGCDQNEGRWFQVGRSCLVDFIGVDALDLSARAEYLVDIAAQCESFGDEGLGGGSNYKRLEVYLERVAETILQVGWLSKSQARDQDRESDATAAIAARHMPGELRDPLFTTISDDARALARVSQEWAETLQGEELSDYLHNIGVIARSGVCNYRSYGLAASIVSSYQRKLVQDIQAQRNQVSQYVGQVGESITCMLDVAKVTPCESEFGVVMRHNMYDQQGNVFVWFSSSLTLEAGKQYQIRGKVKQHKEYNGGKQTCLTRCQVVELKKYEVVIEGAKYSGLAETDTEFRNLLKGQLGITRWKKQWQVLEVG